jgi:hypothetical protein
MEWHGHHSGPGIGTGNSEAWRFVLFFGDANLFGRIEWRNLLPGVPPPPRAEWQIKL